MDDIFLKASKLKLRFDTTKGELSVEDLWSLPLASNTGRVNLYDIGNELNRQLQASGDVFVDSDKPRQNDRVELAFNVVKTIIEDKRAEASANRDAAEKAARKQRIREILAEKKDGALKDKSIEELEAELAGI